MDRLFGRGLEHDLTLASTHRSPQIDTLRAQLAEAQAQAARVETTVNATFTLDRVNNTVDFGRKTIIGGQVGQQQERARLNRIARSAGFPTTTPCHT